MSGKRHWLAVLCTLALLGGGCVPRSGPLPPMTESVRTRIAPTPANALPTAVRVPLVVTCVPSPTPKRREEPLLHAKLTATPSTQTCTLSKNTFDKVSVVRVEPFAFDASTPGAQMVLCFELPQAGTIEAEASWQPESLELALLLNGPAQVGYYARDDGAGLLKVAASLAESDLQSKVQPEDRCPFRLRLVRFKEGGEPVEGKITIVYTPSVRK